MRQRIKDAIHFTLNYCQVLSNFHECVSVQHRIMDKLKCRGKSYAKPIINRPFIWEHIQSNCEVSLSILIKNQLPGVRFNSNSSSITRVFVETAEGYLDLSNSRYNGVICNWDLQDCVAINHKTSSVSGGCTTAGQCSFKGEVCPCFRGNTLHISQGDMFTI